MEDIKRRLELNSTSIKQQTIKKIYDQILKCKDEKISELTPQSSELKFLWDSCGDSDVIVSTSCCQALLELLRCEKAGFDYVLKGLQNAVPSAKNLSGIVETVTDILVLQLLIVYKDTGNFINPYSLRNPPHPFITILTNRSDGWVLLNEQVHRLLTWPKKVVNHFAMELLSPFIKFVLLEPAGTPQFTHIRITITRTCLNAVRSGPNEAQKIEGIKAACQNEENVVKFFLNLVPCLQIKPANALGESINFVSTLAAYFIDLPCNNTKVQEKQSIKSTLDHQLTVLINNILALTGHCIKQSMQSDILLSIACNLVKINPQNFHSDVLLPELIDLLQCSPSNRQWKLLLLVDSYLENVEIGKRNTAQNMTSELTISLLYQPLLNLLTFSDPFYLREDTDQLYRLVESLLLKVVSLSKLLSENPRINKQNTKVCNISIDLNSYNSAFMAKLCHLLSEASSSEKEQWLSTLNKNLSKNKNIHENKGSSSTEMMSRSLVCLVVGMFCAETKCDTVLLQCLQLFEAIAQLDSAQSMELLPVLLYKMNHVSNPRTKLQIIETLPKIATHKVSMSPILRSLQLLGGSPELKALSIRLITLLWQQQDRCFPYLQQILLEKDFISSAGPPHEMEINQIVLAKAAAIATICKLRPNQHGEDMVQPISNILNRCNQSQDAPVVSLVLEALYHLCEAEVIDIKTSWSVLGDKISKDTRPLVIRGICHLFSLVPELTNTNPAYSDFVSEVLSFLWDHTNSEKYTNTIIINAAFSALSKFTPDCFSISHLPRKITKEIIESALAEFPEEFEVDESSLPAITGDCYINILKSLQLPVISGFETFLTSLIHHEILNLPRGLHHAVNRRTTVSGKQDTIITSIPQMLLTDYEKNKQPGLRPGLAASLLFGYDPNLQTGRDGKPKRNHIAQFGRQYHQMLYTLINEVPMQPSEWHKCIVTPMAWTSFMDRCYLAYLEGRRAELQLQLQQGKAESQEENQVQQDTAWLWARDKLTDLIKSCSRGSPTCQGNSVFALVGLTVASNKYASTIDKDLLQHARDEAPEHMSQSHWTKMATNTVLAIMDSNYQPPGRIFSMCQQRTEKDRTPSSLLARSGAAMAISQLIPALISNNSDLVYEILALLSQRLPGLQSSSEEAGVVHFYFGLGIGGVLTALFKEKFLDVSGMQGMLAVWKAVDILETSAFSLSDTRMGSVLGLGLCLSAMCKDGKPDTNVRVCRVQEQLHHLTESLEKENTIYEAACVSLASVTASAYAANILSQDVVDRTVAGIYTSHVQQTHLQGTALALGMVCNGLELAGHPAVKDLLGKLFDTWLTQLQDENVLTVNKVAALHGVIAITGANNSILQITVSGNVKPSIQRSDLIKVLTHDDFKKSCDIALLSCASWLLGQFYLSTFTVADVTSSVPGSYHYLPDTSVLKACTDLLVEASHHGPELISPTHVKTVLVALNEGPNQGLPPVNWPAILSPLMRMSFGGEIEKLCLSLAVKQSVSSPNAAMFIATWILSPLYDSLNKSSKLLIHESLPTLIKVVPPAKLEEYLNHSFLGCFRGEEESFDVDWCDIAICKGLFRALQVNDPPQSVTMLLYDTLQNLYCSKAVKTNDKLLVSVCKCLQQVPDNQVDKITEIDFLNDTNAVSARALFTRCYLVGVGSQPLTWLNQAIESMMYTEKKEQEKALLQLLQCFISTDNSISDVCHLSSKTQWLLELMGHVKNIAYGRIYPDINNMDQLKIVNFLLKVFASAVFSWCSSKTKYFLALSNFNVDNNKAPLAFGTSNAQLSSENIDLTSNTEYGEFVEAVLPATLHSLVSVEPWKQLLSKTIDWLWAMYDCEIVPLNPDTITVLKGCLYALRHSKEFNKINTWSRVYSS